MSLPIRTVLEDVEAVCAYLSKKPTGATVAEARKVLDPKYLDGRKLSAFKVCGLLDDEGGRMKLTPEGRAIAKADDTTRPAVLLGIVRRLAPYRAIVERAAHRKEESLTATEVAAHWHEHFPDQVSDTDKILNDQAVCFFQLAKGAGLGEIIVGRHGMPTRFQFNADALRKFLETEDEDSLEQVALAPESTQSTATPHSPPVDTTARAASQGTKSGQAIFVAHGKNKKPLEQLKRILEQFKIPYLVATEEPNLGRPIGEKVRDIMESCNCAILIFTSDEEFKDAKGNQVWRPSENVVYELGAAGYLYGKRIVIVKEMGVDFPTNFRDLGYISFEKDALEAKAMEVLKELIGFEIVKVTT
jgi:predicted nucleotide-binding protein